MECHSDSAISNTDSKCSGSSFEGFAVRYTLLPIISLSINSVSVGALIVTLQVSVFIS